MSELRERVIPPKTDSAFREKLANLSLERRGRSLSTTARFPNFAHRCVPLGGLHRFKLSARIGNTSVFQSASRWKKCLSRGSSHFFSFQTLLLLSLSGLAVDTPPSTAPISRIALVGGSITAGGGVKSPKTYRYSAVVTQLLQSLFSSPAEVNLGRNGQALCQ